jgi:hypothetical protein
MSIPLLSRQHTWQRFRLRGAIASLVLGVALLTATAMPAEARTVVLRRTRTYHRSPVRVVYPNRGHYHHRRRVRVPVRGAIRDSVLINPTIIDSTITDSVLVNPTVIHTPRYRGRTIRRPTRIRHRIRRRY